MDSPSPVDVPAESASGAAATVMAVGLHVARRSAATEAPKSDRPSPGRPATVRTTCRPNWSACWSDASVGRPAPDCCCPCAESGGRHRAGWMRARRIGSGLRSNFIERKSAWSLFVFKNWGEPSTSQHSTKWANVDICIYQHIHMFESSLGGFSKFSGTSFGNSIIFYI